jgi:hypothetical protein
MNYEWKNLGQSAMALHFGEAKREVLVEYDGPQLILFRAKDGDFLGLAVDSDEKIQRWLLAPASKLELETLALGNLPMCDVFSRKQSLVLVDFGRFTDPKALYPITIAEVPDDILPVSGALLPSYARTHLAKLLKVKPLPAHSLRLRFAGAPVRGSEIELSALGTLAHGFQSLVIAIGEALGVYAIPDGELPSTALLAGATSGGSFAITIRAANDGTFSKIVQRYKQLLRLAFEDKEGLSSELAPHATLRKAFLGYLKSLEDLKAEALIESPETSVYVGHHGLKSVREMMKPSQAKKRARAVEAEPSERTQHRGYFDAFATSDATFAFSDIDRGEQIDGKVSAALAKKVRDQHLIEANVGRLTMYRITIERDPAGVLLVDFTAIGQSRLF